MSSKLKENTNKINGILEMLNNLEIEPGTKPQPEMCTVNISATLGENPLSLIFGKMTSKGIEYTEFCFVSVSPTQIEVPVGSCLCVCGETSSDSIVDSYTEGKVLPGYESRHQDIFHKPYTILGDCDLLFENW